MAEHIKESTDFLFEKALQEKSPVLSKRYSDCISVFDTLLQKFQAVFPTFSDHSLLHSMNVMNYSNILLGEQAEKLSAGALYAYMMAVALHDGGMTVNEKQFADFSREAGIEEEVRNSPELSHTEIYIRY